MTKENWYMIGVYNSGKLVHTIREFRLDPKYETIINSITELIADEFEKNPINEGDQVAWDRVPSYSTGGKEVPNVYGGLSLVTT